MQTNERRVLIGVAAAGLGIGFLYMTLLPRSRVEIVEPGKAEPTEHPVASENTASSREDPGSSIRIPAYQKSARTEVPETGEITLEDKEYDSSASRNESRAAVPPSVSPVQVAPKTKEQRDWAARKFEEQFVFLCNGFYEDQRKRMSGDFESFLPADRRHAETLAMSLIEARLGRFRARADAMSHYIRTAESLRKAPKLRPSEAYAGVFMVGIDRADESVSWDAEATEALVQFAIPYAEYPRLAASRQAYLDSKRVYERFIAGVKLRLGESKK